MKTASERRDLLKAVYQEARVCVACPLHETRTTVVFGSGNADADLMFVGEAPGANEDLQGLPFVGQAGKLLEKLLGEIGMERGDVFIANTLKCLRYNAQIQLGDGSWERIGRLVRTRYSGTVMSVTPEETLEPRQVTGWHATPLAGRRVFKLTYASAKRAGASRVGIQLTGDHPVLTERGYVRVQDLEPGERIATGQGLSSLAFDVACGSLLGDASIPVKSSCLTFAHSEHQLEYARFKAVLLRELAPALNELRVAAVAGGERVYGVVHVRTRATRALRTLRRDFYAEKKVVPAWIADRLTPRMVAFWFMDDGYTRIRGGGRRPLAEIATNGFSESDLQVLIRGLSRLGVAATASRGRLYFNVDNTERLSAMIAPFVPEPMRYKLHPDVESSISFDRALLASGPAQVVYDEVVIEDVTDESRADTTFFCLDVEDTHNFVTSGGVVHNCRPPGNRDPYPHELEACRHYLDSQLELIEPTVICTLGNFATKLLRGEPTGISRIHGQAEVRTIGPRTVRLYPLYHPAAALYTPSTLEMLRADFLRIPEILALGPPDQPTAAAEPTPAADPAPAAEPEPAAAPEPAAGPAERGAEPPEGEQLGLF